MSLRSRTAASIRVLIATLLLLTLLGACQNRLDKDDEVHHPQAKNGPAQISVENGETVLALDTATQSRLGLQVATLTATVTRAEFTCPAVVLPIQDLTTFRNTYIAAQTQLQKSRVELDVAGNEYARLKALFGQEHNISEKSLQSAEGALKTSEADERAGEQQLNLQESIVRHEWGGVASKWAMEDSTNSRQELSVCRAGASRAHSRHEPASSFIRWCSDERTDRAHISGCLVRGQGLGLPANSVRAFYSSRRAHRSPGRTRIFCGTGILAGRQSRDTGSAGPAFRRNGFAWARRRRDG